MLIMLDCNYVNLEKLAATLSNLATWIADHRLIITGSNVLHDGTLRNYKRVPSVLHLSPTVVSV